MTVKIKKSHHLITSRFHLKPREQDLVSLIFKGLKRASDDVKFKGKGEIPREFTFHVDELMKHFSLSRQGLYDALGVAVDNVMGRVASVKNPETQDFEKVTLCSYARFAKGQLTLRVDDATAKYMLDYSKGFAEIDLKLLLALKGGYEKRILELISRFKDDDYSCSLDEFYKMLEVDPSNYKTFSDFRKTVIEKPLAQIIKISNGVWTAKDGYSKGYVLTKKGGSYKPSDRIRFKMRYNDLLVCDSGIKNLKHIFGLVQACEFDGGYVLGNVTPEEVKCLSDNIDTLHDAGVEFSPLDLGIKVGRINAYFQLKAAGVI